MGESLVSWRQATKMDLEWRKEEISWWEFWIPLQLNCRMEPSEWTVGGAEDAGGGVGGEVGEVGGVEGGVWNESVDEEEGEGGEGGGGGWGGCGVGAGEQTGHCQLGCQAEESGRPEHL